MTVARYALPLAVALTAALGDVAAQDDTTAIDLREWFPVGETLIYQARFGIIPIGRASMTVLGVDTIRGTPALHIRFHIEGGTFFYRLDDKMDSWIGLHDFHSLKFVQDYDEGGKKRYAAYHIYPDSGFYRQAGIDTVMETSAEPLDDTAFIYFARTVHLEPGRRYEFNRYFKPDRNPVVLDVLGRDTIDVPAGKFPTFVVQPIIKGRGILAEARDARLWISDDDRRIIVQLKTRFPFGSIRLRLRRVEGPAAEYASPRDRPRD